MSVGRSCAAGLLVAVNGPTAREESEVASLVSASERNIGGREGVRADGERGKPCVRRKACAGDENDDTTMGDDGRK